MQKILLILLVLSTTPTVAGSQDLAHQRLQNELSQYQNIVDVTAASASDYAKLAVSYHDARLAADAKNLTLTLNLSSDALERLKSGPFTITDNATWLPERKKQIADWHNKTNSTGIPGFPCYATVEETFAQAQGLASNHSNLAEWIDIGDSWAKQNGQAGYDLYALKITNKTILAEKPILVVHSAMHAREYTPAALNLDFARYLLENYQTDADAHWLVNHHEIHLILHLNPDGRKMAEEGLLWRKNANNNACPGGTEGVDLNRNFAFSWNVTNGTGSSSNPCDSTYRGSAPESEPETQALSNYLRQLFADRRADSPNAAAPSDTMGLHIDLHSFSELILWPWGNTDQAAPNGVALQTLGRKIAWFNGYTPQQSVGLYPTDGTSDDPSYGELGIAALTFELGTAFFQSCTVYENDLLKDNLAALMYAAKASRAPYLLPAGPDIVTLSANQSHRPAIRAGDTLRIAITSSDEQYNQTNGQETTHAISSVVASVDDLPWGNGQVFNAVASSGETDSATQSFDLTLDTTNWTDGTHLLYVTATDQAQQTGVPSAMFIDVGSNQSPTADFTFECDNLQCQFDATNSQDDQAIVEYQWRFSDNTEDGGAKVDHTFAAAGNYPVTLTVSDAQGYSAVVDKQVTVIAPDATPASTSSSGSIHWLFTLILILYIRKTSAH